MVDDAGDTDLANLLGVARRSAMRHVTWSAGHEVDDILQDTIIECHRYAETHAVDNPEAIVSLKRRAWKYRDRREGGRRNPPMLAGTPPPAQGRWAVQ